MKLKNSKSDNISIDSVFISNTNTNNLTIHVVIRNQGEEKNNIPIAIFNADKLISKQSYSIKKDTKKTIPFTIKINLNF